MFQSKTIGFLALFFVFSFINAQETESKMPSIFDVKVRVIDKTSKQLITNAEVSVNGKQFPFKFIFSYYLITVKSGDELIVSHPDFQTVYYRIKDDEDIKIEVVDFKETYRSKKSNFRKRKGSSFLQNLDSAKFFMKKDLEKSLNFLEAALKEETSNSRKAAAYKTLADVYQHWNQFDLATKDYENSLRFKKSTETQILFANSLLLSDSLVLAEKEFKKLKKVKLTSYQSIQVFEGLGDVYLKTKKFETAIGNYQQALTIAQENFIESKITDINSKIADVYVAQGLVSKATLQFQNSLSLAAKENKSRSVKEKEKVANFFNQNRQFDKEIELRKEALEEVMEDATEQLPVKDSIKPELDNTIKPQTINYKIGRAYVEKGENKKAIPFLQKSIETSNDDDDLELKKDATRKLSEAFADEGDYGNALRTYQDYVKVVDALYIKKEQEIERAKRLGLRISEKENRITGLEKDKILNESKINLAIKDQELSQARNKNQLYIIYSLVGGIALMLALAFLLLRINKQQKLANNLLALKSMRSQMNPHFIFNALNSVNSFIAVNDERNANRYLSEFSVLMRSVLENSDEDFIPLTKEIELIELYTKLEHNRFKDKFDYEIFIDDSINLEHFMIPPMLLQPYIENAIWHGLRYKSERGNLEITLEKVDEDTIKVSIKDDGVGRKKSMELKTKNQLKQKSKGMSTSQKRIQILNDMYKDTIAISVSDVFEDGSGTQVELFLKRRS